jgi:membrane fusion protein (multidrug efflux system)
MTQEDVQEQSPIKETTVEPTPRGRTLTPWIAGFAVLILAAAALLWWRHSQGFESTDDAQVEGHLDSVSSRISGTVVYINPAAEDNHLVQAGTLLVELDPQDYDAELEHAKADLDTRRAEASAARVTIPIVNATAFGQLRAAEAAKEETLASVEAEQANLTAARHRLLQDQAVHARAERDRLRYLALVEKHEISRSDYDARDTEATAAAEVIEADRAGIASLERKIDEERRLVAERDAQLDAFRIAPQQVSQSQAQSQSASGRLEEAAANLHTARLNLSYTKIYAPVTGVVGRKTVELGHRIQPGQGLMVIVPLDDIWITANFKETQLKHMRPGQPVEIHVDTFGRDFQGFVENLPGAAGPLFSLFPPENSSGNYVKVVQRFPVRIRLNKDQDPQHVLRPGMSVEPVVSVR